MTVNTISECRENNTCLVSMFALIEVDALWCVFHLSIYKITLSIYMDKIKFFNFFRRENVPGERQKHQSAPPGSSILVQDPRLPKSESSTPQLIRRDVGARVGSVRGSVDKEGNSEARESFRSSYSPGSGRGSSPFAIKKRGSFNSISPGDSDKKFLMDVVAELSVGIEQESVDSECVQVESKNTTSTVRDLPYFYDSMEIARTRLSGEESAKPGDYVLVKSSMIDHVLIVVRKDRRTAEQTTLQMLGGGACVPVNLDGRLGFEYASIDRYVEANIVNQYKSARPLMNKGMKGRLLNVDLLGTERINFYDINAVQAKELLLREQRGTYLLRKASVHGNFVTVSIKPGFSRGEGVIENVRLKLDDNGACVPVDEKTNEPVSERKYASVAIFVSESYRDARPYRPQQMTGW